MPYYYGIKYWPPEESFTRDERIRTTERLLILRDQLEAEIPTKTANETLLLATWNLRDFDSNKFGHGPRQEESFYYIAEIISAFDLVALQEINEDLSALKRVMRILGRNWDYIVTDVTEGRSGNQERMAFVYDKCKISFRNIAGEIVLPDSMLISDHRQFARTPFIVAFQAGWFKFMLCTVHIYYGADSGEKLERRIEEIKAVAGFLAKRAKEHDINYILMGDFNIKHPEHKTMEALEDQGFSIPEQLKKPSNIKQTMYYDQIAFKTKKDDFQLGDGGVAPDGKKKENADVFEYDKSVFTEDDYDTYKLYVGKARKESDGLDESQNELGDNKKYYREKWRTFQMSDHLPMWVELKVDFSDRYLEKCKEKLEEEAE
jgi:endonuclease/exonuclease/phosphatase family metal-dependent hydrolase